MKKNTLYFILGFLVLGVIGAIIESGNGFVLIILAALVVVFIVIKISKAGKDDLPISTRDDAHVSSSMITDKDDFIDWGDANRYRVPAEDLLITYRNQAGHATKRKITLQTVLRSESGDLLVHAYCHLRDANRTFNASRIEKMMKDDQEVDVESYLGALVEQSPERIYERLIETREEELLALMYIAKIDGRFTKAEREIMGTYFSVDPDTFPSFDMTAATYKKVMKVLNTWDEEKKAPLKAAMISLLGKKPDDMKKAAVGMLK